MNTRHRYGFARGAIVLTVLWSGMVAAGQQPADVRVSVQWNHEGATSKTVPSVTLIPYPPGRKGRPLHEAALTAIRSLNTRYARILPFGTHPRLSVAELRAPTRQRTFWDFSFIDPEVTDFLQVTAGREPTVNFGPIPCWMFKGGTAFVYDSDPDKTNFSSCSGGKKEELIDPTGRQVADYFARIASWYTAGGFTDELGQYHASGHHFELPWWGVLNEVDVVYSFSPQQYTRIYDAVVAAVHKVSPATRFRGLELAYAAAGSELFTGGPEFVEYFLDPRHHAPGTPIDMASFHIGVAPARAQSFDSWQYTFFDQLAGWMNTMAYVDATRRRFSPKTLINVGEIFALTPNDALGTPIDATGRTPKLYWNLMAAFYADAFIELGRLGADIVTASQLIGPPDVMPDAGLIDLQSGKPRPELQVIKLLTDHLSSSRILIKTEIQPQSYPSGDVAAQAFRTERGGRLLLINKRNRPIKVAIESAKPVAGIETVDESGVTKSNATRSEANGVATLQPFAVAVVDFQ